MFEHEDDRHYYDILHVSRDAPVEIIRGSYRTLMQKLRNHPDLGGDVAVAARINEAYAVLIDEVRRAEYDAQINTQSIHRAAVSGEAGAGAMAPVPAAKRIIDLSRECAFCGVPHRFGRTSDPLASCQECQSPLSSAENRRLESTDQRAVARFGMRQEITFFDRWPQAKAHVGYTQDISMGGMRFSTKRPTAAGRNVRIVSDLLDAVARIVYYGHERRGWEIRNVVGVSFVTLRFIRSTGRFVSEQV